MAKWHRANRGGENYNQKAERQISTPGGAGRCAPGGLWTCGHVDDAPNGAPPSAVDNCSQLPTASVFAHMPTGSTN